VPSRSSWESKTTVRQCDEKYCPEAKSIKGLPAEIELPLPAGIPFFMKFLNCTGVHRYNVVGTADMDSAFEARAKKSVYVMETRRVIPKLGRSTNSASFPVGAIMTMADGHGGRVPYKCEETFKGDKCGGHYKLELNGDYVCDNCGMIFAWKEKEDVVAKTSYFDTLDNEEWKEDYLEVHDDEREAISVAKVSYGSEEVGKTESKEMKFVLDRVTRNIIEWRKAVGMPLPEDIHVPKKRATAVRASDIYKGRFNELTRRARMATLLHWIKVDKVGDRDELVKIMGLHKTQVVRLLDDLVAAGRIEFERVGHKMVAKYVR
jgi:hypothetical protein